MSKWYLSLITAIFLVILTVNAKEDYSSLSRDNKIIYLSDNFGIAGDNNFNPDDIEVKGNTVTIKNGNVVLGERIKGNIILNGAKVDASRAIKGTLSIGNNGGTVKGTNGNFIIGGGESVDILLGEVYLRKVTLKEGSTLFNREISGKNLISKDYGTIFTTDSIIVEGKSICCGAVVKIAEDGSRFTVYSQSVLRPVFISSGGKLTEAVIGGIIFHNDGHKTIGKGSILYELDDINEQQYKDIVNRRKDVGSFSRYYAISNEGELEYYTTTGACEKSDKDCLGIDKDNNVLFRLGDDGKEYEQIARLVIIDGSKYNIKGSIKDPDKKFTVERLDFEKDLNRLAQLTFSKGKVEGRNSIGSFPATVDYDLGDGHSWKLEDKKVGSITKKVASYCSDCAIVGSIGGIAKDFNQNAINAINEINNNPDFWKNTAERIKAETGKAPDKPSVIVALRYFDDEGEQGYMAAINNAAIGYGISPAMLAAQMQNEGGREFLDKTNFRTDPNTEVDAFVHFGCDDCVGLINELIGNQLLPQNFKETSIVRIKRAINEKNRQVDSVILKNIDAMAVLTAASHVQLKNDISAHYDAITKPQLSAAGISTPEKLSEETVSDMAIFAYNGGIYAAYRYMDGKMKRFKGVEADFADYRRRDNVNVWNQAARYVGRVKTEEAIYENVFKEPNIVVAQD